VRRGWPQATGFGESLIGVLQGTTSEHSSISGQARPETLGSIVCAIRATIRGRARLPPTSHPTFPGALFHSRRILAQRKKKEAKKKETPLPALPKIRLQAAGMRNYKGNALGNGRRTLAQAL